MNLLPVDENAHETREFQPAVAKLFKDNGWNFYHTHDSRRSDPGMLDNIAIKNYFCSISELKSKNGVVSDDQKRWAKAWEKVRVIRVNIWRPGIDNDEIIDVATTRGTDPQPKDEIEELRKKLLSQCEHKYITYECPKCMKKIVDGLAGVLEGSA